MSEKVTFTIDLDGNVYSGLVSVDKAMRNVNASATSTLKTMDAFRDTFFKLNNVISVIDQISSGFDSLVGSSLQFEQAQINMRTMLNGSTEAADALLRKIREYGKATVYETMGLVEAQKTMMAFGLEAEFAFERLKNIGDIAQGDSQRMQSLALAFSQTTSTGKLMGQDLLQMINAGFNPLEVISQKTGKSIGLLKEEMSKGAISAELVAQAFQWATEEGGRSYNSIANSSQSVSGRIATMKDWIDEQKIKLFELTGGMTAYIAEIGKMVVPLAQIVAVFPAVKAGFDIIRASGTKAWAAVSTGASWCRTQILAVGISAQLSGGMLKLMGAMGKAACRQISVAIMNIPIIGWIAAAISAVLALFAAIVKGIKLLWDKCYGFRVVIFTIWEGIKAIFTWVLDGLKSLWAGFKENIIDPIWGFITNIAGWVNEHVVQPVWNFIVTIANWINEHIVQPIKNAIQQIGSWFREIFGGVFDWIEEQFVKLYNKIAGIIPGMKKIVYEGRKRADESWAADHTTTTTTDNLMNAVNAPLMTMQNSGGATSGGATGSATTAVATGGTRNTEIHINIGDMIKQVVFNGTTRENQQEIERTFAECLSRVLGMAQVSM
ncbi:MAG: tape measure protein [Paludibacteraceae bacterium]|nr:tape measure protein [Paludibacteraceae bacterium]